MACYLGWILFVVFCTLEVQLCVRVDAGAEDGDFLFEERLTDLKASTTAPTIAPTVAPTVGVTLATTVAPTEAPTVAPTLARTVAPTPAPTVALSQQTDGEAAAARAKASKDAAAAAAQLLVNTTADNAERVALEAKRAKVEYDAETKRQANRFASEAKDKAAELDRLASEAEAKKKAEDAVLNAGMAKDRYEHELSELKEEQVECDKKLATVINSTSVAIQAAVEAADARAAATKANRDAEEAQASVSDGAQAAAKAKVAEVDAGGNVKRAMKKEVEDSRLLSEAEQSEREAEKSMALSQAEAKRPALAAASASQAAEKAALHAEDAQIVAQRKAATAEELAEWAAADAKLLAEYSAKAESARSTQNDAAANFAKVVDQFKATTKARFALENKSAAKELAAADAFQQQAFAAARGALTGLTQAQGQMSHASDLKVLKVAGKKAQSEAAAARVAKLLGVSAAYEKRAAEVRSKAAAEAASLTAGLAEVSAHATDKTLEESLAESDAKLKGAELARQTALSKISTDEIQEATANAVKRAALSKARLQAAQQAAEQAEAAQVVFVGAEKKAKDDLLVDFRAEKDANAIAMRAQDDKHQADLKEASVAEGVLHLKDEYNHDESAAKTEAGASVLEASVGSSTEKQAGGRTWNANAEEKTDTFTRMEAKVKAKRQADEKRFDEAAASEEAAVGAKMKAQDEASWASRAALQDETEIAALDKQKSDEDRSLTEVRQILQEKDDVEAKSTSTRNKKR